MTYQALYRVWRPQTFKDVSGQEMITQTLQNAIRQHTPSHAYLFTGPRGTGKTSVAKIFAKAINCPNSIEGEPCNNCAICTQITNGSLSDVIEIDAASNNGVEEIRDIREKANYAPTQATYKVYIIDEVHMLSMGAFNALLKTLEEPPQNVVFLLATTEPHKIPLTIISRTQRFDFRRISQEAMIKRMRYILTEMEIAYEEDALLLIAKAAEGGMRDALSILDQSLAYLDDKILTEDIQRITGSVTQELLEAYFESLSEKNTKDALDLLQNLLIEGKDAARFVEDVILFARDLLLFKNTKDETHSLFKMAKFSEAFKMLAESIAEDFLYEIIRVFNQTQQELRLSNHAEVYLEVATIKLSQKVTAVANNEVPAAGEATEEIQKMQAELAQVQKTLSNLKEEGIPVTAGTAEQNIKKAPAKTPSGNFKASRHAIYQVLEHATHEDLNQIKSIWTDVLNILDTGQRALLNNAEPVAASPNAVVVQFKYDILCVRAQEDAELHQTVDAYLEKIIHKTIDMVVITEDEWPKIRQDYINQMNNQPEKGNEDSKQTAQGNKEDEVVTKAVEFFGEDIVEVID